MEKKIAGIRLVDPQREHVYSAQSVPLTGSKGLLVPLATQSPAESQGGWGGDQLRALGDAPDLLPGTIRNSRNIFLTIA